MEMDQRFYNKILQHILNSPKQAAINMNTNMAKIKFYLEICKIHKPKISFLTK